MAVKLLDSIPARSRPGLGTMARAGIAGAIAGLLVRGLVLVRQEADVEAPSEPRILDALMIGAGRGLLYSRVVEPRLLGPGWMRGLTYALLEVGLGPWGGLDELLAPLAPHRRIPLLREALGEARGLEGDLVDHLVFGATLAVLYDSRAAERIGIVEE